MTELKVKPTQSIRDSFHKQIIEKLFTIVDKNREVVPFKFNAAQNYYYERKTKHDIILKAR